MVPLNTVYNINTYPPLESSLKPTFTPKHTHLSLVVPWHFPWCLTPLLSLDTDIWSTAFLVLLRLTILLYGKINGYKSPIRIELE